MKTCKTCKIFLDLSHYTKNNISKDGYDYNCRECKNRLQKEFYITHPELVVKMRRKHYLKSCNRPHILLKRIWNSMNQRCNDENNYQYFRYGGRGIKIQWSSLEEFKKDMMDSFQKGLTIERVNNDGDYEKSNCRWATRIEQSNNTRRNVFYDFNREKKTLAQIAREHQMNYKLLWKRVNTYGWNIDKALTTEIKK